MVFRIEKQFRDLVVQEQLEDITRTLGSIDLSWDKKEALDKISDSQYPESYTTHTEKEKLILWYAENFRRQVIVEYPHLPPILLACNNECNIQKMVCTTVKPSTTKYPELHYWRSCAQFVADHLSYLPLDKPIVLPKVLHSPTTVLKQQAGNCFEFATVLVSLLIGAGYDAYVVSGYASREICLNDNTRRECPFLKKETVKEHEQIIDTVSKYKLDPPRDLTSQFIKYMHETSEKKRQEHRTIQRVAESAAIKDFEKPAPDPLRSYRRHAWALILPSKDITEVTFVEPSTGEEKPISDPEYYGIDSIWNNINYWISVGVLEKTLSCENITFDLENPLKWERLLMGEPIKNRVIDDEELDYNEKEKMLVMAEKHLDMASSWVEKIDIPHSVFERRYPDSCRKTIYFKKCKLEYFSPFSQPTGLRVRTTLYEDYECIKIKEIFEEYSNRADLLFRSYIDFVSKNVTEEFHRGRPDGLKEHLYFLERKTIDAPANYEFYPQCRTDGLIKLVTGPVIYKAKYEGREDFLTSIHVVYQSPEKVVEPRFVKAITNHYDRNSAIPENEDIAIEEFDFLGQKVCLQFQYMENHITASSIVLSLGSKFSYSGVYHPDVMSIPPPPLVLYRLQKRCISKAESSVAVIRSMESEVTALLELRENENTELKLIVSEFDEERNNEARELHKQREKQLQEEKEKELSLFVDFLAPYLARLDSPNYPLKYEDAFMVYNDCLKDWKQMLIDRAYYIEQELEKLQGDLKTTEISLTEIQERESICEEDERMCLKHLKHLTFQIHCVHRQLERYKAKAPQKYLDLDARLRSDKRLKMLFD